jgi:hypothetical protein
MWTQEDISKRIRDQLYLLDPEVSADVGTPERKIIDVVAQSLADIQFDNFVQDYQFDIDTKFGQDLDDFVQLFGFARQTAKRAAGFVTFRRNQAATDPTLIPAGTQVSTAGNSLTGAISFVTIFDGILNTNEQFVKVPVESLVPGTGSNVPANSIVLVNTTFTNISSVSNEAPISGGSNSESDDELKLRFKNNIFRNIAGVEDQFLAIAVANQYTNRATIIKPSNKFSEYLQFDSVITPGTVTSANRNAKYIYDYNYYVSGQGNDTSEFYNPDTEYNFIVASDIANGLQYPQVSIDLTKNNPSPIGTPSVNIYNTVVDGALNSDYQYAYSYVYSLGGESTLSPLSGVVTITDGSAVVSGLATSALTSSQGGTVSYKNVYRKDILYDNAWNLMGTVAGSVTYFSDNLLVGTPQDPPATGLGTGKVIFLEHDYMSKWSRNVVDTYTGYSNLNKIDIYISGKDIDNATDVVNGSGNLLNNNIDNKYYYKNYVRQYTGSYGSVNNSVVNLLWTPVETAPSQLTINGNTYYSAGPGVTNPDYWLVKDVTNLRDSHRCRDGIEMGTAMVNAISSTSYPIEYTFNKLPFLTNQVIESHKQLGQDVLVHTANFRNFLVNLEIIYTNGFVVDSVNTLIATNLSEYFNRQRFGAIIQYNNIINIVFQTSGVNNAQILTSGDVYGTPYSSYYGIQEINPDGSIKTTYSPENPDYLTGFSLGDIDLPALYGLGPVNMTAPIQRTQSTWL